MIDFLRNQIKDKSVLLLGFGREGKSSLRMILKAGGYAKIGIADQAALTLKDVQKDIALHTGPDYQDAMDAYDIVFKSPGIVLKRDISEYTCRIVSQTELFFARYHDQIVGITGTKGKSTTAALLHHILQRAGRPCMLAGNIGIPVFDHCEEITPDMTIVVELSCHQLEYMTVSSAIGVLINIYEEHLDHYGTMEKYTAAKQQIYRNQRAEDVLFCNVDFLPEPGAAKSRIVTVGLEKDADISVYGSEVRVKGKTYKIPTDEISLLGHHNYFDIAIDYGICRMLGLSPEEFTRGLKTYETLPHRLKLIAVKDGVKYYDDSISTIDQTAIEALHTLPDADTILIGGMDRGIDYGALIDYLKTSTVRNIILMEATGRRIYREIMGSASAGDPNTTIASIVTDTALHADDVPAVDDISTVNYSTAADNSPVSNDGSASGESVAEHASFPHPERLHLVDHLEDAVALAKKLTRPGHSCILSPAAASYGIFKNFEERGDKFAELVREDNI